MANTIMDRFNKAIKRNGSVYIGWLIVTVTIFGAWELSVRSGYVNPVYFGQPSEIVAAIFKLIVDPKILFDIGATFGGVLIGWSLAAITGVSVAIIFANFPFLMRVFEPFVVALNSLPRVALAPLFLLWFGIGLMSKVALSFSLAFFVVLFNTRAGIESAESDRLMLARVLGASRLKTFSMFILPGAVPSIITGLQLGFIFGMLATIAGEMIAGQNGLGVRLQYFTSSFRMNEYFATLFILVVGTMIISGILSFIGSYFLRWQATGNEKSLN